MSIINPAILTLGSINIDLILSMERLPVAGENLFGKDYLYVPGGKGANQAVAASLLGANVVFYFGAFAIAAIMIFSGDPVYAAETTAAASNATGFGYIAAALSTGLSCVGGGIAVASAASAALGAISEDSSALGKSLIFVGLAEGVCLYGLIISFMILGKL